MASWRFIATPRRAYRLLRSTLSPRTAAFRLRYDDAFFDELQPLAVKLVGRNASPALTDHCLVDMLPQPDLLSVDENFNFAAFGRQGLPVVGVTDLEPGDVLGVAHAPLVALQYDSRASAPFSSPPAVHQVRPFRTRPSQLRQRQHRPRLPCSSAWLLDQRGSFQRVWARPLLHLRAIAFDQHGPDWTFLAIEQLGAALCGCPNPFSKPKTDLVRAP